MSARIPFLDLQPSYLASQAAINEALARVAASGWFVLGPELEAFEEKWSAYCGVRHALGVGQGDEVIVPSNTYIATWLAVSQCGAIPVPVEPDPRTYNLDPARIETAITPRTKVILPVHLYGQPADMDTIQNIAERHGLSVLDDCAQAHGAYWRGRRVGALAPVSAWSFYPGKNLGAMGDGGALTTCSLEVAEAVRVHRNYGSKVKYHNEVKGLNSRLDEIQAAVLAAKLPQLDLLTAQRRQLAARFLNGLAGLPLVLPFVADGADPAWHLFVIRHAARDRLQAALSKRGISTLIHYPVPPHLQPAYAELGHTEGDFPVAEQIHREVLSLPLWPGMSDSQADRVIAAVREESVATLC
jgi:dTDP-4-amino-4,6-dideoxygalactose transaminase